jgi:hypothetical protein
MDLELVLAMVMVAIHIMAMAILIMAMVIRMILIMATAMVAATPITDMATQMLTTHPTGEEKDRPICHQTIMVM